MSHTGHAHADCSAVHCAVATAHLTCHLSHLSLTHCVLSASLHHRHSRQCQRVVRESSTAGAGLVHHLLLALIQSLRPSASPLAEASLSVSLMAAAAAEPALHSDSESEASAQSTDTLISALLADVRESYHLPAVAVAKCASGSSQVHCSGVRKAGDPTLAQATDKFHLGSCAKAMSATVAALLVEWGIVAWEQTLPELLPRLAVDAIHPGYRTATLSMLTSHMSGLPGDLRDVDGGRLVAAMKAAASGRAARQLLTSALLAAPPATTPGERHVYSNAGYMLLANVMEERLDCSWEQLMQQLLFSPLGMSSCGFGCQADLYSPRFEQPWPHAWSTELDHAVAIDPQRSIGDNIPAYAPAGTIHCALHDWAKFVQLHMDGFAGRPTPLLSQPSFSFLHRCVPGQSYTYGGWLRVERAWAYGAALTHSGSNTMNTATVWCAPCTGVAYLATTNAGSQRARQAVLDVVSRMVKLDAATKRQRTQLSDDRLSKTSPPPTAPPAPSSFPSLPSALLSTRPHSEPQ